MDPDLITLAEAARRLELDRSNVLRRARRGDFGEIDEIDGGPGRPALILISAAAVDTFISQRSMRS